MGSSLLALLRMTRWLPPGVCIRDVDLYPVTSVLMYPQMILNMVSVCRHQDHRKKEIEVADETSYSNSCRIARFFRSAKMTV